MSCGYEERIALYACGDLDVAEAAALDQHLAACRECSELLRGLEADRDLLSGAPPEMADVNFAEMRREIVRRSRRPRVVPALLAAAAIGAAVAAGLVWRDYSREIPPPPLVAKLPPSTAPLPYSRGSDAHSRRRPRNNRAETLPLPANAFRVPTQDPHVVIIWFAETKGDSNE